jgi:putative sterol carrier protein
LENIREHFNKISALISVDDELRQLHQFSELWYFSDECFYIIERNGALITDAIKSADFVIHAKEDVFIDLLSGHLNPQSAWFSEKLRIEPKLKSLIEFGCYFELLREKFNDSYRNS